jgi:hypothetical protein
MTTSKPTQATPQPTGTHSPEELEYLFDLNGYLILDNAVTPQQLADINAWIDATPCAKTDTWLGNVHTQAFSHTDGLNYQNIIEGGKVFEDLITNPAWIGLVRRFIFNGHTRGLSIHEAFVNVREQAGYIGLHSGGATALPYMNFRHHTGVWNVGQINIITALTDIGPGDGATVLVPGSHKSHNIHPYLATSKNPTYDDRAPAGGALATQEMHLKAGQSLFFTDAICHGSAARTNAGERRIVIYRYSPDHIRTRFNYIPSEELLARLTPEQRDIVQPTAFRMAPGRTYRYEG